MRHTSSLANRSRMSLLGLLAILACLGTASAQLGTTNSKYGTNAPAVVNFGMVDPNPQQIYYNADYSTGGAALRNQLQRSIVISGGINPAGGAQAAWIYWSVLGPLSGASGVVTVQRLWPNPGTSPTTTPPIHGQPIAIGADPCWGSNGNHIYRAGLPTSVVTGNGNYLVQFGVGAGGLSNGADPWLGPVIPPLIEGAALVVIRKGTNTVTIFDGQAGITFDAMATYTLNLPTPTSGGTVLWDNIGADGQLGKSRDAYVASETTTINACQVAGPLAIGSDTDSDWNGSSGLPLPQLFDVTGHDITCAAPAGTTALNVVFQSQGDCLTTIANVVSQ